MQNPPILTVTGTRRPHDRVPAGSVSSTGKLAIVLAFVRERPSPVYGVTGENGLAFAARGTGKQTANTRNTARALPSRLRLAARGACGIPCVCSGVARAARHSDSSQVYS
jgi:hypothetical protein